MLTGNHQLHDLDFACDAAVRILADRGTAGLSVRAIATEMRITGPALTQRWDNKARLWSLLVTHIGRRWLAVLTASWLEEGVAGLLPTRAEQVEDTRVWLCICDLSRGDADLVSRVALVWAQERELIARSLEREHGGRPEHDHVLAAHATMMGLRELRCAAADAIDPEAAVRAFAAVLAPRPAPPRITG